MDEETINVTPEAEEVETEETVAAPEVEATPETPVADTPAA